MPKDGVEPSWDCSRQILSLVRIPISPLRRELKMIKLFSYCVNQPTAETFTAQKNNC